MTLKVSGSKDKKVKLDKNLCLKLEAKKPESSSFHLTTKPSQK
jgi:hypothetical protein